MESIYFQNKVVLVTGSSRGIGNSIARKFALSGSDVVVNYSKAGGRSQEQGELLVNEIEEIGRRAFAVQADISKKESVKNMFQEVKDRFGRLDFLVLNAAKAPFKPLERLLERELRQLVDTNYMGNIFCIQEALPMLKDFEGKIVFISSLGSRFYNQAYPLGSMKSAMETVVRDMAESLSEDNVLVNGVCGGIVKTDSFKIIRQCMEEIDHIPEELFVEPEEIADAVLFLCSHASRGMRGQTIVVDRGLSNRLFRYVKRK